eukprot:TRINITY_DN5536_c0_g1_i3.p1 TRINITY_DN5536_c0_g1~~TRINITY_DN5536_c0_g1_i3.p1  ORF type:complete len:359 (-),score=66.72 TRINITY_DN5536_c0_g1_i3:379-1455(-)
MTALSQELRLRFMVVGFFSMATTYASLFVLKQAIDEADTTRMYWYISFIGAKMFLNLLVALLDENNGNRLAYSISVIFQCQYLYDVYLSFRRDRKTDSMQVSRFLLVAFECIPLSLLLSYTTIENDELSLRRSIAIGLSIITTAFVISEIDPSPQYECGFRYLINFTYRVAEVIVFICVVSLFAAETGSWVFVSIPVRYIILVSFSIFNQRDEWRESKRIETIAAFCFCFCDIGLVLWTAKLSNRNDPSVTESYFIIYRASVRSFLKALLLQDLLNVCMFSLAYFLSTEVDNDMIYYLVFPLFAAFTIQHLAAVAGILTHPQLGSMHESEQGRYTHFEEQDTLWRWTDGSAHSLHINP